jgi:hypothetical protein
MIVHNKTMMLMQAGHLVHKLMAPCWQYKPASSVCKALVKDLRKTILLFLQSLL